VQVIDLDAAMGSGDNLSIVRHIAARLTCRVGGGIRTARAPGNPAAGAQQIIVTRRSSRTANRISNSRRSWPMPLDRTV
jgi:phosphoribosylformimino-5-aminoimidazole carboxamide ribonucleotide (ProFAR) isomerase